MQLFRAFAFLFFASITLGTSVRSEEPVTPKSDARPGKAEATPGALEVGKYVQGRLGADGASKAHYWGVDLQPGKYFVILDTHRSDERQGHVGVTASWVGGDEILASTNNPFGRERGARLVNVKTAGRQVLKVENRSAMAEYQVAVVKADAPFNTTWLLGGSKPQAIKVGEKVTTPELDGGSLFGRDAFYLVTLPEGDFKLTASYKATGPGTHFGVEVTRMTPAGAPDDRLLLTTSATDREGKQSVKVQTADEVTMLLRVQARDSKQVVTFGFEKLGK